MEINGPWAAGEYTPAHVKFRYRGPVRRVPAASRQPLLSTVPMVVNAKSKHVAAAQTFFAWFLSKVNAGVSRGTRQLSAGADGYGA